MPGPLRTGDGKVREFLSRLAHIRGAQADAAFAPGNFFFFAVRQSQVISRLFATRARFLIRSDSEVLRKANSSGICFFSGVRLPLFFGDLGTLQR